MRNLRNAVLSAAAASTCAAYGQTSEADLRDLVYCSSPDAVISNQFNPQDGDPPMITVASPAAAEVSLRGGATGGTTANRAPSAALLDVGTTPEGDSPVKLLYTPDGSEILILHRASQNIIRVDAAANVPTGEISLDDFAIDLDISPDGSTVVVANYLDDSVTLIDLTTDGRTKVAVGDAPGTVDISPDGALAVVGCTNDSAFVVVDMTLGVALRTIAAPDFSQLIAFSTESASIDFRITTPIAWLSADTFLVPGRFDDLVARINAATGVRTDTPLAAASPAAMDVAADGSFVLIGHDTQPGAITVYDAATATVLRTITNATRTNGPVAISADGTTAVVAFQNLTRVLDLTTDTFGPDLGTSNLSDVKPNFDRTRAVGIGYSGAVIDFATGALLGTANNRVSTPIGAVSPVSDRAAMASTTFGDDLVVIDTDATPALLAFGRSGPAPEGDVARTGALSPSGATAVAANVLSDNLAIFDTVSGSLLRYAPLDERPGEVVITPDGKTAVGVNLDGYTVSVVDLATGTTVDVPSPRRASQVEIAPDGSAAYIAVLSGVDGVHRLDLTTNTLGPVTPTGNMGGVGYSYAQVSQMALSPDGSELAIAGSFTDDVTIVDTETMSAVQTLPAGTFPARLAWNAAGDRLLVSDRDADRLRIFNRVGSTLSTGPSVLVGDSPFDIIPLPGTDVAFVLNWGDDSVSVIDTEGGVELDEIPLPHHPVGAALRDGGGTLAVVSGTSSTTLGAGEFTVTRAGAITLIDTSTYQVVDAIDTGYPASMLASSAYGTVLSAPSPGSDGLLVTGTPACPGDVDGDNDADSTDLSILLTHFGTLSGATRDIGDLDGDGDVDSLDLSLLLRVFASTCESLE